jgi:hypothetical protein
MKSKTWIVAVAVLIGSVGFGLGAMFDNWQLPPRPITNPGQRPPSPRGGEYFYVDSTSGDRVGVGARCRTYSKKVEVEWTLPAADPSDPPQMAFQDLAVRYWPSNLLYLGDSKLAVAGKNVLDGSTVLEIWKFEAPKGGATSLTAGSRSTVAEVFSTTAYGPVVGMWEHAGASTSILVQFDGSFEIAAVDTTTGSINLVLSPTITIGGLPAEPMLTAGWHRAYGPRDHSSLGYIYGFTNETDVLFDNDDDVTVSKLIMVDSDRDGSIDYTSVLTPLGEVSAGLTDPNAYVD